MASRIAVEVADHRFARRRVRDLPHGLHGHDPEWVPRLADDPSRFDARHDPWFCDRPGRAAFLLARVRGGAAPVGRCSAHHVEGSSEGWFGFLDTIDDPDTGAAAVGALVARAATLLAGEGCTSITGPASYRDDQEAGVQVGGGEEVTGRPRTPPWLAGALESAGFQPAGERPTWRVDPEGLRGDEIPAATGLRRRLPKRLRPYADERLLLAGPGAGRIIAVPDLVGPTRAAGSRWELARRASARRWDTAVVLEVDGPADVLVPAVAAAAADAGYRELVTSWVPRATIEPDAVHRLYRKPLTPSGAGGDLS